MRKEYRRRQRRVAVIDYIAETWKNKLGALFMICCGMLGVWLDNDATALVFVMFFAVPMFFSRKDWFY